MAKQISVVAGKAARKQSTKPGPVVQVVPALAPVAAPTPAPAVVPAAAFTALPVPPAVAVVAVPAPVAVALRGGLAVVAVSAGKPYRVQAGHNLDWLTRVQVAWLAGGGVAPVQALVAAGVPAPFIGYMVRRGYAVPCALPAPVAAE